MTLHVEARSGVDKVQAEKELEKALENATLMHINIVVFDPGTLPEQEGKAVRWKDIRDRPDGYKGWLNMFMDTRQI
jgi:phenylacetate-coenzyme A ligase PaaK-like adenylate-forming protein